MQIAGEGEGGQGGRRGEIGGEVTRANGDGHEQLVRENTGRPSFGTPTNPDSTSMRLRKAETPPCGCPAKYEDRGLDVTAQSACSLGALVQDTACPHRAWALWREPGLNGRGKTRVCPGVSGLAHHLQNPGLSWGLGWARMESFAYLTGLH